MLSERDQCRQCRDPGDPLKPLDIDETDVTVRITPNDKGNPPGKLADAEIRFVDGVFAGLKLIGFATWERRTGAGRNFTFLGRQYSVNGQRRSFALLRPVADTNAHDRVRDLILSAYSEYEQAGPPTLSRRGARGAPRGFQRFDFPHDRAQPSCVPGMSAKRYSGLADRA